MGLNFLNTGRGRRKEMILTLKSNEDWLKFRKTGIGASEASAVLGISQWRSALEVYADKISKDISSHENERMMIGKMIEPTIAKIWEQKTGLVAIEKPLTVITSEEIPYVYCTPDRWVGEYEFLELKNTSYYRDIDEMNVPLDYIMQCQHSMLVAGVDHWHLAVLCNGNHFFHTIIERSKEMHDMMREAYAEFWQAVQNKTPPVPDNVESSKKALSNLFEPVESQIELDDIAIANAKEYKNLSKQIKELEEKRGKYGNKLRHFLQEKTLGIAENIKVSWKEQKTNRLNSTKLKEEMPDTYKRYTEETTSRVLSVYIKEKKDKK